MTFGLTLNGFKRKRLPDIKADLDNSAIAEFGEVNLEPQSIFGQLLGLDSKSDSDIWEVMEDVYYSQYPSSAEGIALDWVVALNGITRLPPQRTSVIAACEAQNGTLIPANSQIKQAITQQTFFNPEDGVVSPDSLLQVTVSIEALAAQIYNAVINGDSYFFSLPTITFDDLFSTGDSTLVTINDIELAAVPFNTSSQQTLEDIATAIQALTEVLTATTVSPDIVDFDSDFVTSNSIVATINGTPLSAVPFNVDHATTLSDLATAIQADSAVSSCTVTGARQLTVVAVEPTTFTLNSIVTTGGASQPTATITETAIEIVPEDGYSVTVNSAITTGGSAPTATISFEIPDTIEEVGAGIVSVINNSSVEFSATDNLDGTFLIEADDSEVPFSLAFSANMDIDELKSPVDFLATAYGPIPAPIGTVNQIVTPIGGWFSVTNFKAGVTGRDIETDAELRLRRRQSIKVVGAATVEAIRSRILQQVPNVTECYVYENRTLTEEDMIVIFSSDFVTSNEIVITLNGVVLSTINFTTNHLTTMQLIKVQLESQPEIQTATISGTGNRTLTIEFTQGYDVFINDIQITGGASQPEYSIQGGRVPKSFEAIVQGGTDEDIANKIWEVKPAGIQTFGNTTFNIIDSQGDTQAINFSRPTTIYIWVTVDLTLNNEETFPTDGTELVEQQIVDYGNTLNVGDDVLFQRVLCQIFEVEGIKSGSMQIASTTSLEETPSYGTSDITIGDTQIAVFALDRTNAEVV